MIESPSGKFEGKFDVDKVASYMGTPGMQDLAFLLPGDTYNLDAILGGDKKKDDDDELIASKDPDFIPGKKEEILFEDRDYLSTAEKLAKERDAKRIQESIDARAEEKNQDIRNKNQNLMHKNLLIKEQKKKIKMF